MNSCKNETTAHSIFSDDTAAIMSAVRVGCKTTRPIDVYVLFKNLGILLSQGSGFCNEISDMTNSNILNAQLLMFKSYDP